MRRDPKSVVDGFQAVTRGINSGIASIALGRDQFSYAINTTFRGYFPQNRPGFKKRPLKFWDANRAVDTTLRDRFEDGLFQGASVFERLNCLVASIGGRAFRIQLNNWQVQDISITGDLNPNNRRRAWFVEAEDFLIIQDGQSKPLIYDGALSFRSDIAGEGGVKEVPTGTAMAYTMGRLWVAVNEGRGIVAGDIVYGPSGTQLYARRDAILKFTENDFLNEGGAFGVPLTSGPITSMRPIAQLDTSTGQGPLQVFTSGAVFSINAPTSRDAWKNSTYPIQTISLVQNGATSDWATVNVNGDIWYRSLDGVRSFIVAYRDHGTWTNTPLSNEAERILEVDDRKLLNYTSSATFDNRLLTTVYPYRNFDHGTIFQGLAVLDFSPLSFMSTRNNPAWEGLWNGLNILQIVSGTFDGVERCFLFTLGSDNDIELWELTKDANFDSDGSSDVRIKWVLEPGSYSFPANRGEAGFERKRLTTGDIWYDNITGEVDFDLDYRPDQDPCWQDWHTWESCAAYTTCLTECSTPDTLGKQYRHRVRFPEPSNDCDSIVNKPYREGYEFQPRLIITGSARIKKFRMIAHVVEEDSLGSCETLV